jgi:hypothetical protein
MTQHPTTTHFSELKGKIPAIFVAKFPAPNSRASQHQGDFFCCSAIFFEVYCPIFQMQVEACSG